MAREAVITVVYDDGRESKVYDAEQFYLFVQTVQEPHGIYNTGVCGLGFQIKCVNNAKALVIKNTHRSMCAGGSDNE